jgi:integrase/recombinase XerD
MFGMPCMFPPVIIRYRAERAVSARDESVSWVVVSVADYALHAEAVAYLAALRAMDRSPNTERVYAGRVALYLSYAADRGLDWSRPGLGGPRRVLAVAGSRAAPGSRSGIER